MLFIVKSLSIKDSVTIAVTWCEKHNISPWHVKKHKTKALKVYLSKCLVIFHHHENKM